MLKRNISFMLLITTVGILVVPESFLRASATKADGCGVTKISTTGGTKSHFFGLNCIACHTEGRKGKGCFTVSGSVLDEDRSRIHKNPIIELYTGPKGTGKLVATIKGDALGNFYTTENINFSTGLYPTLIGTPGSAEPIKHMSIPVFTENAQCNKCHGYKKAEEALGID